jgi:hypothetical protein
MKDWGDKYIQTQVYCPTIIMNRCIAMEECARNMAIEYNGDIVTQDDYRGPMIELGEVGKCAIENIRIQKPKKEKVSKPQDTDKDYRTFEIQEEAIVFGKTLNVELRKRSNNNAPQELQSNGKNPSVDELLKRMWGLNKKRSVRMVPTIDNKWCVYWRPSLIIK